MNEVKEKKKLGLTTKIFISLIAGAIVGIALNMFAADVDFVQNVLVNGVFYVVGQGFIRLMQMLVVPLVFCSLICGATAIGDSKTLGKVGVKIIGFYIFTTMMAVAVALGIGLLIKPGMGLDMSQIQTAEVAASSDSVSFAETLLNIIPKNPIGALANGEMLQVIVFALIVGVILAKLQDKTQLVTNFFQQGNDIMMEMTMMVMGLAPIGVFCLISKTFAGLGSPPWCQCSSTWARCCWRCSSSAAAYTRFCWRCLRDSIRCVSSRNSLRLWALRSRPQPLTPLSR